MFGAAFPICPTLGDSGGPAGPRLTWPNGYRYRWRNVITPAIHQMLSGGEGWVKYRLTNPALKSVANGGHIANDAAWPDIRCEAGSGAPLEYERESWNASTGALVVYVHLTNFVAEGNFTVLIYYGKTGIAADEANPAGCWTGFAQSVDMSTGIDRSGNGRHFTLTGVTAATLFGGHAGDFPPSSGGPEPEPPPPESWWDLPRRSGRAWAAGTSYWFNRSSTTVTIPQGFVDEEADVALIDAITGSSTGSDADGRPGHANWDNLIGGPIGGPLVSTGTQFDWGPTTLFGFGHALAYLPSGPAYMPDGVAWLCWAMNTIPETEATTASNSHIWQDILDGDHDAKYIKFGERIVTKMAAVGHPMKRLLLDANHEMNQSNIHQVFGNSYVKYKAAMERTIDKMSEGAGQALQFIHRPAYRNEPAKFAPYLDYVPSNVAVLSLSMHPGAACNSDANVTKLFNGTLNADWYGTNELFAAATSLNKPVAFSEWSPKNDASDPCPIANTFITRWYNDVLVPNASRIVCDCIFSNAMRDPDSYAGTTQAGKDQFANMTATRKTLWSGIKTGTVVTGTGLTDNTGGVLVDDNNQKLLSE